LIKRFLRSELSSTNLHKHSDIESLEKAIPDENDTKMLNEKAVLINLMMQKNKIEFEDTIVEEYLEKVIYFGFIVVKGILFKKK
jgi:uncharacterized protein (DUF342 family)